MTSKKSIHLKQYKDLINILIEGRHNAGKTQLELASQLDKPQSFVSKYENAERRLDMLEFIIIAKELNIDLIKIVKKFL